jgi:hypothetical protein
MDMTSNTLLGTAMRCGRHPRGSPLRFGGMAKNPRARYLSRIQEAVITSRFHQDGINLNLDVAGPYAAPLISRMIHLALTIAAALFLFWVLVAGLAILAHTWKWVLGIVTAIPLLLFMLTREHPANLKATHASEANSSNALTRTLPERLRVEPPLTASLPQGEEWLPINFERRRWDPLERTETLLEAEVA